ncbi:hypothetical protein TNCV_1308131 [Trichonephila clavipes]|nr:hypothetical protein TNCV_1308131 [Trichonephila clavipes]
MVADSTPAEVNRFSRCDNRRYACHMIIWHVKDPLNINGALALSAKSKRGNIPHPMRTRIKKLVQASTNLVTRPPLDGAPIWYGSHVWRLAVSAKAYLLKCNSLGGKKKQVT